MTVRVPLQGEMILIPNGSNMIENRERKLS